MKRRRSKERAKGKERWRPCIDCRLDGVSVLYAITPQEIDKLSIDDLMLCPMHREITRVEKAALPLEDNDHRPNRWGIE